MRRLRLARLSEGSLLSGFISCHNFDVTWGGGGGVVTAGSLRYVNSFPCVLQIQFKMLLDSHTSTCALFRIYISMYGH